MATSVVSNVIYPPLVKKIKKFGNLQITKRQWKVGITTCVVIICGCAVITTQSYLIVTLIAGVKYLESAEIFNILLLFLIIQALSVPIKLILYAVDKEKLLLLIVLPLPILKIIFNYIGFELFGIHGMAYSTVTVYFTYLVAMLLINKNLLKTLFKSDK
jgi:O-antigen/teichoic acid export membrane protein